MCLLSMYMPRWLSASVPRWELLGITSCLLPHEAMQSHTGYFQRSFLSSILALVDRAFFFFFFFSSQDFPSNQGLDVLLNNQCTFHDITLLDLFPAISDLPGPNSGTHPSKINLALRDNQVHLGSVYDYTERLVELKAGYLPMSL